MTAKADTAHLLKFLTETVAKHDTKLALDYQAIQHLDKDTDKLADSVEKLTTAVSSVTGTVAMQSKMLNAVLAVTVIAFLGVVVRGVVETSRKPSPEILTKEFVSILRNELNSNQVGMQARPESKAQKKR